MVAWALGGAPVRPERPRPATSGVATRSFLGFAGICSLAGSLGTPLPWPWGARFGTGWGGLFGSVVPLILGTAPLGFAVRL